MMKKILLRFTAISLLAAPLGVYALEREPADLSFDGSNPSVSAIETLGQSFTLRVPAIPAPEIKGSSEKAAKGDFTAIPDYAFGYINELTVKLTDAAQSSVDVVMFSITLKDMPEALVRARDRGVKVRMIIDEKHVYPRMDTQIKKLIEGGGIDIRTLRGTRSWGVNHNKIGIYDGSVATSGSYNWTFGATFNNFENMYVAKKPVYVKGYIKYFDWMWAYSRTLDQGPSEELPQGHYGVPPQDEKPAMALNGTPVPAYLFSPGSDTENRLAQIIGAAKKTLDIVTFTFSSKPLADAIVAAHKRGVKVRFMMDQEMGITSIMAKTVFDSGVEFKWRRGRSEKGALHNKYAIMDGKILETGSFNWTTNASVNSFENVIFIKEAKIIKAYQATYEELYSTAISPVAEDFKPEDPFAVIPPPVIGNKSTEWLYNQP